MKSVVTSGASLKAVQPVRRWLWGFHDEVVMTFLGRKKAWHVMLISSAALDSYC